MSHKLKIALRACAGSNWFGGVNYINNLGHALLDLPEEIRPEIWVLSEDAHLGDLEHYAELLSRSSGLAYIGEENPIAQIRQIACQLFANRADLQTEFDAVFPVISQAWEDCPVALSWIPDFQHMYYHEFFSREEIASRNRNFRRASQLAKGLILSSEDARKDLSQFDPSRKTNVWTLPFYSKLNYDASLQSVAEVRQKYSLPREYICCINQFWAHKDHETLFKAVALLKQWGHSIPLVCSGSPSDYRNHAHFQHLMALVEHHQLQDQIHFLGHIPREDQIQMIRASKFVVQPSLFEGWSTVLEDCRALGKEVLASDLGVHKEQNPPGMQHFAQRDSLSLAKKILSMWAEIEQAPNLGHEISANKELETKIQDFARNFCQIVRSFQESLHPQPKSDMNYPKISIVTPNYNQGAFLEKCIQSVLNQNYPNLEYIIIDGGSTDQSVEIIKKYQDRLSYWISENDRGQSHAINKGLAQSSGQIWAWLNGDDWYEPGALFEVAKAYQQNPEASAWVGACHRLHDNGWLHYISYPNGLYREHLGNNWNCRQFYQPSCFMNRAKVAEIGGLREELHFTMDIDLFLKLAWEGPFIKGDGIWSTALAQTDAKTVKQMDKAFAEHANLDEQLGFPRGAENIRQKIAAHGAYSDYVPADAVLEALKQNRLRTPFEFYQRSDLYFVADFSTPEQVRNSLVLLKEFAETVLERAPSHRILLCGPGAEQWQHLQIPGKIEVQLGTLQLHQAKLAVLDSSPAAHNWFLEQRESLRSEGIPLIALAGPYCPVEIIDGVNGFVAQTSFELSYKAVLFLIEPSVFGSMSAMTLLQWNEYPTAAPSAQSTSPTNFHNTAPTEARVHIFLYSWNKRPELEDTLRMLAQTDYSNFKLFVLNNGSNDGTKEMLDQIVPALFKDFKIIHLPVNVGAAAARNWLWSESENDQAEYIAYFDDDVLFEPSWLKLLLSALESEPLAGVVGAKILNATGPKTIQHSGGVLTKAGEDWLEHIALWGNVPDQGQFDSISERDYVMGCCNLYRTSAMKDVGEFDVQFSPSQFDDVDHHLRLRLKGWKVLFHGGVEIRHLRNSGGGRNANHIANRYKLAEKYKQSSADVLAKETLKSFVTDHPWVLQH